MSKKNIAQGMPVVFAVSNIDLPWRFETPHKTWSDNEEKSQKFIRKKHKKLTIPG